jgi:sugar (pentulose or hexulose) kinase
MWAQIIADVTRLELEVTGGLGGAALGAAFIAGVGQECFRDWQEIERFTRVVTTVRPHVNDAYERGYQIYRDLYPAIKEVTS